MKKFTLVEMLVVVAIIGILVSILLPSIKAAREKAMQAVCKSNLHQASSALLKLALDNNEKVFPPYYKLTGSTWWSTWGHEIKIQLKYPSLVLDCPSFKPNKGVFNSYGMPNTPQAESWNPSSAWYKRGVHISKAPNDYLLLADSKKNNKQWYLIRRGGLKSPAHTRHSKTCDASLIDGSVHAFTKSKLADYRVYGVVE